MSRSLHFILGVALSLFASPATAHPHVFVDVTVALIFDADGRLSGLRVSWSYDELYSLMLIEERGLDADGDGALTPAENTRIQGFDMNWEAGFAGDSSLVQGGRTLELSPPQQTTAEYRDGRLISTHLRQIVQPVDPAAGPIVMQAYDPSYYTAYSIEMPLTVEGRADCTAQVFAPDPADISDEFLAALDEQMGESMPVGEFPSVGAAFSDEIRVACGAGAPTQ
ncbi:MAG: DUF1007 family protein [Paracoccaceae bacterium]